MNSSAIYSKSGKGVQEATGKTSHLKRHERAVLTAVDGRSTVAEVAQKVGKPFDAAFEQLIALLDRQGYIREVSTSGPQATVRAATPAPAEGADDLDFTLRLPRSAVSQPRSQTVDLAAKARAEAQKRAQEEAAFSYKARQEAEARARAEAAAREKAEREARLRAEAERSRAEAEAQARRQADAKARAESEAKMRAAQEALARAAAEAEARAKAEAERRRKEAEEEARREAEARARREAEERARKEAEEKARKDAEEKARKEAEEKARREAEEKARREAEERARREEERRKREEEERLRREAQERARREEEERIKREAEELRLRKEAEERARKEAEEQARKVAEELERREAEERKRKEEEAERFRKLEEERARRAEEERLKQEQEARRIAEEANRLRREAEEQARREEEERKAREQAEAARSNAATAPAPSDKVLADVGSLLELGPQHVAKEPQREKREEAETRRQADAAAETLSRAAAVPPEGDIVVSDEDIDMEDVRRDQALIGRKEERTAREQERQRRRAAREQERERKRAERERRKAEKASRPAARPRVKRKWGRAVAITFFSVVIAAVAVLHVMPFDIAPYEKAATEALGQPVKIRSARLSFITGPQINLAGVSVGEARVARARLYPQIGSLFDEKKAFSRIELEDMALAPAAAGAALFGKARGERFAVEKIIAKQVKLTGPLPLPPLDAEVALDASGALRSGRLAGPDGLVVKLAPAGSRLEFEASANTFALPFMPKLSLGQFGMKGMASQQDMVIDAWDAALLGGLLRGNAKVRWGGQWVIEGMLTAKGVNAAVFAPALLSEGRADGSGRFSFSGAPEQLASSARMEGNFVVNKGVLGSFDLSRAIQTSGRQPQGRTPFAELTGQALYDRGAVALRQVSLGAGALHAGASADITPEGALSGRIVADVKTANQTLRATLNLAGSVKEPQVRN